MKRGRLNRLGLLLAGLLGYRPGDYITKSYLGLYLDQCRRQGTPPSHMVFSAGNEPQKK